jgi:anti-anti-sigma regulatory factor
MAKRIFRVDRVDDVVTVLTAQADLDLTTEQAAGHELARLAGAGPVVVDVSGVFVALAGLRMLLSCIDHLRASGRAAELVVSTHLHRVARIIGSGRDDLRLSVPDALAQLRTEPGEIDMDEQTGPEAPADDAALATSLVELLSGLEVPDLLVEQHLLGRLEQVLAAAEALLHVDRIGLMLLDEHDRLQVVGASDPASSRLERAQQQLGVGPAIDSLRTAQPVAVADLAASRDGEHPHYGPLWEWLQGDSSTSADEALVRSVLSVPVRARGRVVGTLNLARSRPGGWGERQLVACQAYADVIGVLLTLSAPLSDDSGRPS